MANETKKGPNAGLGDLLKGLMGADGAPLSQMGGAAGGGWLEGLVGKMGSFFDVLISFVTDPSRARIKAAALLGEPYKNPMDVDEQTTQDIKNRTQPAAPEQRLSQAAKPSAQPLGEKPSADPGQGTAASPGGKPAAPPEPRDPVYADERRQENLRKLIAEKLGPEAASPENMALLGPLPKQITPESMKAWVEKDLGTRDEVTGHFKSRSPYTNEEFADMLEVKAFREQVAGVVLDKRFPAAAPTTPKDAADIHAPAAEGAKPAATPVGQTHSYDVMSPYVAAGLASSIESRSRTPAFSDEDGWNSKYNGGNLARSFNDHASGLAPTPAKDPGVVTAPDPGQKPSAPAMTGPGM